jgi:hypothetical protein
MTRSNYPLRLQSSLLEQVRRLAEKEATSANQFINVAVAEKLSGMEVASYFRERAKRANIPEALALLDRLGTEPPRPGDELEPGGTDASERLQVSSGKTGERERSTQRKPRR